MNIWHFYDKVYRRWVVLLIGPFANLKTELADMGYKEVDQLIDANGYCMELTADNTTSNQNCTVLWLKEYSAATLVHEITHLTMFCFDQVGVPIDRANSETFAFYSEYWFTQIQRARKRWPNGNNPKDAK